MINIGIDLEDFCILSTSALVIRWLFPNAGDLDIAVTPKGLQELKSKYNLKKKENDWYIVDENIECIVDENTVITAEKFGQYNLQNLEEYYKFLENSKRQKDIEKKIVVENELNKMEYLQVFDENRNILNGKILRYKGMKPKEGRYINITIVFIENNKGEFLIQKTSKEKGSIFATTGGLVKFGSTSIKTIVEEIKEELGIDIDINDLKLVYTKKHPYSFQDTYYIKKDINIEDLTLQKEEVEFVKWMSIDEINELIEKDLFRKGNIEPFKYIIDSKKND